MRLRFPPPLSRLVHFFFQPIRNGSASFSRNLETRLRLHPLFVKFYLNMTLSDECPDNPSLKSRQSFERMESDCILRLSGDAWFMGEALRCARRALEADEVPVGAVIVQENRIIARAWNQVELLQDATAHAEILAITQAEAALGSWRLNNCTLYATKEPCAMCAGAMVQSRIQRVVFGAPDAKSGAAGGAVNLLQFPTFNHQCRQKSGVREAECAQLLKQFFQKKRANSSEPPASSKARIRARSPNANSGNSKD